MLHRKLKESERNNYLMRNELAQKDHELVVIRQRANSNEAKARDYDQVKRRIQQLEAMFLRQQMVQDLNLNRGHMGGHGFGPDHFGGDGIC